MNHDLYIPRLTPAIARNILRVENCTNIEIDPIVRELATRDRNPNPIAQHILDHNYRCVIPYGADVLANDIRDSIAELVKNDERLLIYDSPISWNRKLGQRLVPFMPLSGERFQFCNKINVDDLLDDRAMTLVMSITSWEYLSNMFILGKLFKKIIIICPHMRQKGFGRDIDLAIECAQVIDMNIETTRTNSKYYPLYGIYVPEKEMGITDSIW